jgi:hypothetical protein
MWVWHVLVFRIQQSMLRMATKELTLRIVQMTAQGQICIRYRGAFSSTVPLKCLQTAFRTSLLHITSSLKVKFRLVLRAPEYPIGAISKL